MIFEAAKWGEDGDESCGDGPGMETVFEGTVSLSVKLAGDWTNCCP